MSYEPTSFFHDKAMQRYTASLRFDGFFERLTMLRGAAPQR